MASASAPSPVPFAIARSMLSLGIEASLAFWTALARVALASGSPPPSRAATVIARASLVKCWPRRASTTAFLCLIWAHLEWPAMARSLGCPTMPQGTLDPSIFKAYDVRGLYGEQMDGDVAEAIGRGFARVLSGLAGKPAARAAHRPGARHAPHRARDGGALLRGPGGRGRARHRRRDGRHRDALLPRRLARARRRRDGHRLAQPEALHGRQARQGGRDRALGRRRHPGRAARDRGGPGRRARRRRGRAGRHHGRVPPAGAGVHRSRCGHPAPGRRRRRQRDGRADGRPAARAPRPRPRDHLLDAQRRVPRPRAQPAAGGEPALHRREGPLRGRRARDRVGRRRRPLLLHRRRRGVRRRRLRDGAPGRLDPAQGAGRDDPLRRAREPRGAPTRSSASAAPR